MKIKSSHGAARLISLEQFPFGKTTKESIPTKRYTNKKIWDAKSAIAKRNSGVAQGLNLLSDSFLKKT